MSGHSKWAQIKRQKALVDNKRGQVFTKLARAITIAARHGADPAMNATLQQAIDRARAANMPKNNIDRAIQHATDTDAAQLEQLLLEAYGPGGVGMLINVATNNHNRTIAELRHLLSGHKASLGTTGSVLWQFERHGTVWQPKQSLTLDDTTKKQVTDLVQVLEQNDDVIDVTTNAKGGDPYDNPSTP